MNTRRGRPRLPGNESPLLEIHDASGLTYAQAMSIGREVFPMLPATVEGYYRLLLRGTTDARAHDALIRAYGDAIARVYPSEPVGAVVRRLAISQSEIHRKQ